MPSPNVGDTAPSTHQHRTRSHGDPDRQATSGHPYPRPQHQSTTQPERHRSSSKGPQSGHGERTTRVITPTDDESRSRPRADLKGPPSESYTHPNDPKDAGGPTERKRAQSVSSSGSFEVIEKQRQPSSSNRDNVSRSSTKDDSNSGSRNTPVPERKSYPQVAFDQSLASIKSDNTGPRSFQPSAVNPETKPAALVSGSTPKQTVSNLPRAPTDTVSASSTTQNSYPPSPHSIVPDDSILPSVINTPNYANPAVTHVPSPDLPVTVPPGLEATQQPRSSQHHQQQGESKSSQGVTGFIRTVWSGSSGTSPKDRAAEERAQYELHINNLQADMRRFSRENRSLKQRCEGLEHENSRLKDNNNGLQHELNSIQRELEEAKSLSEIRGKELMGAQVFLTKADSLSMSDVIDKVGILNEEIFQTAALFAEGLHHKKHELSQESLQISYEQSRLIIGEHMTGLLRTQSQINEANPDVNPLLAQAVISTFMVQFCISKLNLWFPSDSKISDFLTGVYNQMRHTEDQAVFGRWRSLLHAQIRPSNDEWRNQLIKKLEMVLNLAFWDAPIEAKKAFNSKLGPIFKALEDARIALYEKFTSADLEAFSITPSGPFQSWMEDAYGDGRQAQSDLEGTEIVAGTTGIGLKRFMIVTSETGELVRGKFESVIPPKVVLESTLKEALEPPPPPRKGKKRVAPEDGGR